MELSGKRFSTVGFGADCGRIEVHSDFKFILITHIDDLKSTDSALLNRFEKQEYIVSEQITPE
jgi:hypothetical protein